jgi:two-component system chemotaxis response regulator CheB
MASDAKRRPPEPADVDTPFDVVALASSAGGLNALTRVLSGLSEDFRAAILAVQHLDRRHRSLMADILNKRSPVPVQEASNGDRIEHGRAYIAPPDNHLLVNGDGTLTLSHSDMVHFVRPSADLLFESVAATYGDRAIAVVLTGTGKDASMGVRAVKKVGGTVIAQDQSPPRSSSACRRPPSAPGASTSSCRSRTSPPPS